MYLNDGLAFSVTPLAGTETQSEFSMPNGTVTVLIDRARGVMEIFAEHEADPLDWELTCGLLHRMGLTGSLPRADYLKGVDTWSVQLKPEPLRSAS